MYSLIGILFCILEGILVAKFGWIALLWSPIGFFVGLFASANTLLPIFMGAPKAASLVSKNEMRPTIFLALIWAPIIWISVFFLFRWLFPSAYGWVINNETLTIGFLFGVGAILLSPFFKNPVMISEATLANHMVVIMLTNQILIWVLQMPKTKNNLNKYKRQ